MTTSKLLDVLAAEIAALDDDQLDNLADSLAPVLDRIADRLRAQTSTERPTQPVAGWLNSAEAAAYVGLTVHSLHKHMAARTIPFEQERPGCKAWFKQADLDAWRRGEAMAGTLRLPKRFQTTAAPGALGPRANKKPSDLEGFS
jgi:hypothetical protein